MVMEDGCNVFFFLHFLGIGILAKFDLKIAKLVEFTVELFLSNSLSKKKTLDGWAPQELGKCR